MGLLQEHGIEGKASRDLSGEAVERTADVLADSLSEIEVERAVREFRGALLLDLDETLYFRNSSQDFLAHAKPRFVGAALLRLVDRLRPWRFTGEGTADVWRTLVVSCLMPWVWLTWRQAGVRLGREHANSDLVLAANASAASRYVVTLGFGPIVSPIVAGLGIKDARIVSCGLFSFADRRAGKLAIARRALSESDIRGALVVTDSVDDLDLLEVCAVPIRKIWPQARFVWASRIICLPFDYLSRIKRPGAKHAQRVLRQDFGTWLIALLPFAVERPVVWLSALALFVAFWSIYELGYFDNDMMAARERDGVRTAEFDPERLVELPRMFYVYAAIFSLIGLGLAGFDPQAALRWALVLVVLRLVYFAFNRIDKTSRVILYLPLQLLRMAAIAAVFPYGNEAVALALSYAIAHWTAYIVYRGIKVEDKFVWPSVDVLVFWLVLDVTFTSAFWLQHGVPGWIGIAQALLGLLLISLEARVRLKKMVLQAHWI